MKEIGGYFGLEQLISNEYYKDLIPLNSGRNALLYLLKVKNIKKVYVPYYLCDSVADMLKVHDYDFEYYNVDSNFMPVFSKAVHNGECLYIVNYYGQLTNDIILSLKGLYGQIVIDNTHAFFQRSVDGVDTIYNCRKFFGVPDGAYLYTNARVGKNLIPDISKDRMVHILGRYEGLASDYYSDFKNNDENLKTEPLRYMSKLTHNILGAVDYEKVCRIRNENYAYLENKLEIYNRIKFTAPYGAFAYPFYVKNGIEIREKLTEKKIYVPTLWPNVVNDTPQSSIEYEYAANILPLPCDQRYGIEDMEFVVEEVKKCIN